MASISPLFVIARNGKRMPERQLINMRSRTDVMYWQRQLSVPSELLKLAVRRKGNEVATLEKYLSACTVRSPQFLLTCRCEPGNYTREWSADYRICFCEFCGAELRLADD